MFRLKGHRIGDPWFYVEGDTVHMWFLVSPEDSPERRGSCWDIGHAVSGDLVNWDFRGMALVRDSDEARWDSRKLATGSVMHREGRYWMAYTGHRRGRLGVQRAGMAWSTDLEHWTRIDENPVTEAMLPWYDPGRKEEPPVYSHWRDPFLVEDGEWVYQLICARDPSAAPDLTGIIGRARSRDMLHWEIVEPLDTERIGQEMECPVMHHIDGRWYLLFSSHPHSLETMQKRFPEHTFRSETYSMVSDEQWGPYRLHGTGAVQRNDDALRAYAGQLVPWYGQWFLFGFVMEEGNVPAEAISDPIPVVATPEGIRQV